MKGRVDCGGKAKTVEKWCGEQDSNLRTDKEWDLNPPPLTKLGDPRATRGRSHLDLN